ncbi:MULTISPECIES: FAD-binding protein [Streptosporangium]|uniref:2-polyprenyl-6-methoxyphenol hydroxylase-like FAD-dependent oxidoreductase n=1 Tax=Streptosporangium brasiliense TaxID=47480 RepID=A0ABT9RLU2_9ACTN|nr:FAD-binding protein [Streptosporangium brasiliense]MDP9870268.1 2-polyprenyl-6-methoxyphenol hydroxylase-like FAD-dependent oxidoreductase [Streptosporangium brasiliense]
MSIKVGDRAVVLGGSITGLFAASALSKAYREVVLVDRDTLIDVTEWRRGAPQTRHINGLLARGQLALEEMFPGITQEMVDDGIPLSDMAGTVRWYFNGEPLKQVRAGLTSIAATRPIMEFYVRRRVQAMPNVTFMENTDIVGLVTTADHSRVTGARVQAQAKGSKEQILEADLVIDAAGRGSRTPLWLEQMGYLRVQEDGMKVGLGYVSRHYVLKPGTDPFGTDHSINPVASATLPRGAIFTKTDSGKVELTAYGILGDHPPTDPEGFNEFVKTLAAPEIYETIIQAEPLDDPALFRFPTTMWRRYDLLPYLPERFLIMGDAVCTPNPVYAQAQTLASLEALALHRHLARGVAPKPKDFQQDVADIIKPAWEMTSSVNLSFPGVQGKRTLKVRAGNAFMRLLQKAATQDPRFTAAFMRVAGLIDPPETLMRPALIISVLRQLWRKPALPSVPQRTVARPRSKAAAR